MAEVIGKIGALKSLKAELNSNGISHFKSIKELNIYRKNFASQKEKIVRNAIEELKAEYLDTCESLKEQIKEKEAAIIEIENKLEKETSSLKDKIASNKSRAQNSIFLKLFICIQNFTIKRKLQVLSNSKSFQITLATIDLSKSIAKKEHFISEYETNPEILIKRRVQSEINDMEFKLRIINQNQNLISGAIGENLVLKELKKLSDNFVVINDVNLRFSPPIYNKRTADRIYSIQIDHVVVSTRGIFILETKNWSKTSINSLDLRSPVEQIKRANYGLYRFLSNQVYLDHHWGEKRLPIRNVIVMVQHKPQVEFKYVSVKTLNELNNYLDFFEPVLSKSDVRKIVNVLK